MIAIIDYKINNLISIYNSLKKINRSVYIASTKEDILKAQKLILPGVGTYYEGMKNLRELNLIKPIKEKVLSQNTPILGICLGMQLMSTYGYEVNKTKGLNLIEGSVEILSNKKDLPLPHIGWNDISFKGYNKIFNKVSNLSDLYFIHSYHFKTKNKHESISQTTYSQEFSSVINRENIYGFQFHPEKSGKIGMQLLENFLNL